jgi:hypothetical protein
MRRKWEDSQTIIYRRNWDWFSIGEPAKKFATIPIIDLLVDNIVSSTRFLRATGRSTGAPNA